MLSFKKISVSFGNKTLIRDLSFRIDVGDKAVFSGASGSGKSSLINTLTGFVRPSGGKITFENEILNAGNIEEFRSRIAYLPQQISFNSMDVKAFIRMPFHFDRNKSETPGQDRIAKYFDAFSLKHDIIKSKMQDISGGEKQRVALISCLLLNRKILLLDEPTSALDSKVKNRVMDWLFNKDDITIISASHDPEWVERCNKVIGI